MREPHKSKKDKIQPKVDSKDNSSDNITIDNEDLSVNESSSAINLTAEDLNVFDQKRLSVDLSKYNVNKYVDLSLQDKIDISNKDLNDRSTNYYRPGIANLVYLQRSPRIMPSLPDSEIEVPRPPQLPNKPEDTIDWLLPIGMVGIGIMMAVVYNPMMMLLMVPMALLNLFSSVRRYKNQLKKYEDTEKTRKEKYGNALQLVWEELNKVKKQYQYSTLNNHIGLDDCAKRVFSRDRRLWERTPADDDFLLLRLGLGSVPFPVHVKYPPREITLVDDPLLEEAQKSEEDFRTVENVPICVPLLNGGTIGVTGERGFVLHTARALLVQMAVHHSYDEVKVVVIYNDFEERKWSWVQDLPHCSDNNRQFFAAQGKAQARELLSAFYDMIKKRELAQGSNTEASVHTNMPYYVFVLADREIIENEPITRYLMYNNQSLGICSLFLFDQIDYLPSSCNYIISVHEKTGQVLDRQHNTRTSSFIPDTIPVTQARKIAEKMAPLRLQQLFPSDNLPEQVSLLDLYGVRKVEDLSIWRRWNNSKAYNSLAALIGVKIGQEQLSLDIHDRFHGPHGLVAGTTGSGKSEFLQSLILSLSINYHPHEVMFVLIDYKGGGMANVFKGLPHLAGIITNLEGNQTTRALLSVKSELRRRQSYFDQAGVNHIDKYIQLSKKGKTEQAIPHLIIIVDEFAELKSEQPDFMSELVSTARVGRSLGVHLILATQKPAGIVDEQIWGNARFRVCLKVQSTEDSQEVLKRTDASTITLPGRSYLQVGNNEIYELFQSAFSGASYEQALSEPVPEGPITVELGDTMDFSTGRLSNQPSGSHATELEALVRHMEEVASRAGIKHLQGQWLPPLPEKIVLSELTSGYGWNGKNWIECPSWLAPNVGLVDNPTEQSQYPLQIDLGRGGHLAVYGSPGSGKTTFIQSLIASLALSYSPEDVSIYILDFGGRTLVNFASLPHVGGVVTVDDEEKLKRLMKMLLREIDERKRIFADNSVGSLKAYRDYTGKKIPALVIAVDNYTALNELYPEAEEFFQQFSREGGNFGIHLVLAGGSVTSIQYKTAANIKQVITFQLSDSGDYSTVVGRTGGMEPEAVDGRGLVKGNPPLEFQAALAVEGDTEADRAAVLNNLVKEMDEKWQGRRARPIPVIPEVLQQKELFSDEGVMESMKAEPLNIALGLDMEELEPVYLNLNETPHFLIAGKIKCGKTTALKSIATALTNNFSPEEIKLYLADSVSMGLYSMRNNSHVEAYAGNQPQLVDLVDKLFDQVETQRLALSSARSGSNDDEQLDYSIILQDFPRLILLIDDFNDFMQMAEQETKDKLEHLISRERNIKFHLLTAGMTNDIGVNYEQLAKTIRDFQSGLLFGDAMEQQVFNLRVSYTEAGTSLQVGEAYMVNRGQYVKTKIASA